MVEPKDESSLETPMDHLEVPSTALVPSPYTDKKLTPRESKFLEVLFEEAAGDIRTAMTLAGYSKTTPTTQIRNQLSDDILAATKLFLSANAPAAAMKMISLLFDGAKPGASNEQKAAEAILDRVGVT